MRIAKKMKQNELEKIRAAMLAYLKPEILIWEYKDKINIKNVDKKKMNQYDKLLSDVDYFFKIVTKYDIYFSDFYPTSDKISETEALEYHVYAYLENLTILKNKLSVFLVILKNDLKRITSNKQEIDGALKAFIEKVENTFNDVKKHRNPHHHQGFRFLNSDIVDVSAFDMMLQDDFPLKDRLKVENVKKRKKESFEKAKKEYIELANKNTEQITGLINTVFKKNSEYICKVLKIKSLEEIMKQK